MTERECGKRSHHFAISCFLYDLRCFLSVKYHSFLFGLMALLWSIQIYRLRPTPMTFFTFLCPLRIVLYTLGPTFCTVFTCPASMRISLSVINGGKLNIKFDLTTDEEFGTLYACIYIYILTLIHRGLHSHVSVEE